MKNTLYISTWFYGEGKGEESVYPQVQGVSSSSAFQEVYWKCVVTFFASSVRCNPQAQHILFVSSPRIPIIGTFDIREFLSRLGVRIEVVPFTYRTPQGFYGSWRNQFYVFDIIHRLAQICEPDDACILLDSDCVWVRPASLLQAKIAEHEVLTYDVYGTRDWVVNGLGSDEMRDLSSELLDRRLQHNPRYYGGEIFAATGTGVERIGRELGTLWEENLTRFRQRRTKFNEEAHALSHVYLKLGYEGGTANDFIRRMWTSFRYSNVGSNDDFNLAIWHLPAEKRFGLRRLFRSVKNDRSRFWHLDDDEYRAFLASKLGIPRRTTSKFVFDLCGFAGGELAKLFRGHLGKS